MEEKATLKSKVKEESSDEGVMEMKNKGGDGKWAE